MLDASPPIDPVAGEPIVITARALPDPAADRAYSVEQIGPDRLQHAPSSQLEEILKQVPGLQLFRRSDARSGHPTSQGVTIRALGGNASSRVLLTLDGVPQADPFGGWINWPAYDPQTIAEVRVIRGGGSVASGAGALGGVIEMTSSLADGVSAGLEVGSRESVEGRLRIGGDIGAGRLSLSARGSRGGGFIPVTESTRGPADERADYSEAAGRFIYRAPVSGSTELQASGSAFVDRRSRGLDFTDNNTDGAEGSLRMIGSGRWKWSALGYAQWREFESSFASVDAGRTIAQRVSLQDSVPSHAFGGAVEVRPPMPDKVEVRIGTDFRFSAGESRELFAFVAGEPTRRRVAGGETMTAGMFAEATADVGRFILSGGARVDRWRISDGKLIERVIASGAFLRDERYDSRSGWRPTVRAGAVFRPGERWSLRTAAYLGWRPPTLNELFRPFRAGADATAANPMLDPERLAGVELGAAYRDRRLALSATAFANRMEDAIVNVTLGEGPGFFPGVGFVGAGGEFRQRMNIDALRVRGVELSGEWRRGAWSAHAAATLLDAEMQSSGDAQQLDSLRPAQTPRFFLTAGIGWERDRAASVVLRHAGSQFEDDRNLQKLPPATTVDAFLAWPIARHLRIVARGENLLNERVVAGIGGDGTVERAQPLTFWLGMRFGN